MRGKRARHDTAPHAMLPRPYPSHALFEQDARIFGGSHIYDNFGALVLQGILYGFLRASRYRTNQTSLGQNVSGIH